VIRRVAAAAVAAVLLAGPQTALAVAPRASLPDIEDEVMCPVCGVPLNIAEAPQAQRERELIRSLIARGYTKAQIKRSLVDQFGADVLALPRKSGFGLAAYLVPIGLGAVAAAGLGVALVRWRRRTVTAPAPATPAPSGAQARRLEEDLSRYDV
jgi:cytochrome c-type biogenesis protein CcmH